MSAEKGGVVTHDLLPVRAVRCVAGFADADGRRTCLVHDHAPVDRDRPFDGCGR